MRGDRLSGRTGQHRPRRRGVARALGPLPSEQSLRRLGPRLAVKAKLQLQVKMGLVFKL